MPEPLPQDLQQALDALQKRLTNMSDAEFQSAYKGAINSPPFAAEEPTVSPMEKLGSLIASTPDDIPGQMAQADANASNAANRQFRKARRQLFEDELKRRGLTYTWVSGSGYAFVPIPVPETPVAPALASEPDAPPADPSIETGHYDDGHAFGWQKKELTPPEDAPPFGWTKKGEAPPADKPTGSLPIPLIGAIGATVIAVAAVGFALANNRPATTASATSAATVAAGAAGAAATSAATSAATAAPASACQAAPDLQLTLSGAVSGTVTRGCVPTRKPPQTTAANPYCRLQGIPNPPNTVAGVLSVFIAFVADGRRYEISMEYVADERVSPNNGKLPATIVPGGGEGDTRAYMWDASKTDSSANTTAWRSRTGMGSVTFGASGASGTIDAEYTSAGASPLRITGSWQVAGGCPRTG